LLVLVQFLLLIGLALDCLVRSLSVVFEFLIIRKVRSMVRSFRVESKGWYGLVVRGDIKREEVEDVGL